MLNIKQTRRFMPLKSAAIFFSIAALLLGGGYTLLLATAPNIPIFYAANIIDPAALAQPKETENKIIIPKINVDIPYGEGKVALDRGAQWRFPDRGNPYDGGNFIIAAHRFSIQPTPQQTVVKSPFYHLDKLAINDQIIVDYDGVRYGYSINKIYSVTPDQTEIEAPSKEAKLTLYSCELSGSDDGRVVLEAEPLGPVRIDS